jgi:hypothetical protein
MTKSNGFELAHRATAIRPGLGVIVTSGTDRTGGGFVFSPKPFSMAAKRLWPHLQWTSAGLGVALLPEAPTRSLKIELPRSAALDGPCPDLIVEQNFEAIVASC